MKIEEFKDYELRDCHLTDGGMCGVCQADIGEVIDEDYVFYLRTLIHYYREKMRNDGMNGRRWDASAHLDAEDEIKLLESMYT